MLNALVKQEIEGKGVSAAGENFMGSFKVRNQSLVVRMGESVMRAVRLFHQQFFAGDPDTYLMDGEFGW